MSTSGPFFFFFFFFELRLGVGVAGGGVRRLVATRGAGRLAVFGAAVDWGWLAVAEAVAAAEAEVDGATEEGAWVGCRAAAAAGSTVAALAGAAAVGVLLAILR